MVSKTLVAFTASHCVLPKNAVRIGEVTPDDPIEVSLYLKPRALAADIDLGLSRSQWRTSLAAARAELHRNDIQSIRDFAAETGLTVTAVEPGRRLIKLSGSAAQMQVAFSVKLAIYEHDSERFRGRSGALHLPHDIEPIVEAVLGLDTRRAARPNLVVLDPMTSQETVGHRPNAVGQLYGFPPNLTGAGECIAIIELGGGYLDSDNVTAFAAMGLPVPDILAVSVDTGTNSPGNPVDSEVDLDIQVAGGNAPGAKIAVYFAPDTKQCFVDAVTQAAHDAVNTPSVISISWSYAEADCTQQFIETMNNALQDAAMLFSVSVFVGAGDHLATDNFANGKANVRFPGSSPWAIGCGGTTIQTYINAIYNEVVWNQNTLTPAQGTGGGISDVFPVPAFQAGIALPPSVNDGGFRRGVPDVAANADPASGYLIIVDSVFKIYGGTSAVAPLWAALTALLNEAATSPLGFFLPKLYKNPWALRDITAGNNKPFNSNLGYDAGPGWDACTGLGVPIGQNLLQLFTGWPTGRAINHYDTTYGTPAAAVFQNQVLLFWQSTDVDGRIACSQSGDGINWRLGEIINNTDSTPFSPAACVFQNQAYVFFRSNDDDRRIQVTASANSWTWPGSHPINSFDSTPAAPSCCVFQNKLYVFWIANDGSNNLFFSSSADGVNWPRGQRINNGDTTPFTPSACVFDNKLYLFWRANDSSHTLYYSASSDGVSWPGGQRINQQDSSANAPASCVIGGKLFVAWRASDGSDAIYLSASAAGTTWPPGRRINNDDTVPASLSLCAFGTTLFGFWKSNNSDNFVCYGKNAGPNA